MKKFLFFIGGLILFISANQVNAQTKDTLLKANIEITKKDTANAVTQPAAVQMSITNDQEESDALKFFAIFCIFVAPVLMVVAIIAISSYNKRKREAAKVKLMEKALESGKDISVDFFSEKSNPKKLMNQGVIWISVGIGTFLFIYFSIDRELSAMACIPFFIGAGQLIAYFLNKREDKSRNNEIEQ